MRHVTHLILAASFTLVLPASVFSAQSDTKVYKVSFTIPATVSQQNNDQLSILRQQISSTMMENRSGQLVKVESIVVP